MADIEIHNEDDFEMEADTDRGVEKLKENARSRKGRGFGKETKTDKEEFESMNAESSGSRGGPQRSVEGWIVFVTNLHDEASEDDVREKFEEFGNITNMSLNMDRRTGLVKGYALIEYSTFKQAEEAISNLNGSELLGLTIGVEWTFMQGSSKKEERKEKQQQQQ